MTRNYSSPASGHSPAHGGWPDTPASTAIKAKRVVDPVLAALINNDPWAVRRPDTDKKAAA